jgi:DNA-binding IclR family transcriptional regulator
MTPHYLRGLTILRVLTKPMTAHQLVEATSIPYPSLVKYLTQMEELGLVRNVGSRLEGRHRSRLFVRLYNVVPSYTYILEEAR